MNIPSIESLLSELYIYKLAYESCDAQILSLKEQRNRMKDERDAALVDLETERLRLAACGVAALGYFDGCKDEYYSASLTDTIILYEQNQQLKSALREAKEALVMNIVGTGGRTPAAHNAIATINKVLGEE